MNRIGWTCFTLFGMLVAAAMLFVDFGGQARSRRPAASPPDAVAGVDARGPLTLPVAGVEWRGIAPGWGDPRDGGMRAHTGTDIMAPAGTPVVAAADGVVEKLFFSQGGGGITAYVRSPDRRLSYYYAHLAAYAADVREGVRVRAGQAIGYVGDTGNAGKGNPHLHFGIERLAPDEPWHRGRPVDPYPLLARGRSRE